MTVLEIVVSAVGSSAVLFGAVAWMVKSIVNHVLTRDIEKFKLSLQNENQQEQLRMQSTLQLHEFEHQVLFSKLHERRACIIADIYGKLYEFYWAACAFVKHYGTSDEAKKTCLLKKLEVEAEGFKDFFDKHRIYFSEETCSLIDKLINSLDEAYIPLSMCIQRVGPDSKQDTPAEWFNGAKLLMNEVPKIKSSLEHSFRQMLGVNQTQKKEIANWP